MKFVYSLRDENEHCLLKQCSKAFDVPLKGFLNKQGDEKKIIF